MENQKLKKSWKKIELNELVRYTQWPEKLLYFNGGTIFSKNKNEVYREYETDKYSTIYEKIKYGRFDLNKFDSIQYNVAKKIAFSLHEKLYEATIIEAMNIRLSLISQKIQDVYRKGDPIVELGSGSGQVIIRLAKDSRFNGSTFHAGDFSPSGLKIIDEISRTERVSITTGLYDFYSDESELSIPPGSIIFTAFSLGYYKDINIQFWIRMQALKPRAVIIVEPIYQFYKREKLFGLFCKRYIEANDYSQGILPSIESAEKKSIISIESIEKNVIGVNPICPLSIITLRL